MGEERKWEVGGEHGEPWREGGSTVAVRGMRGRCGDLADLLDLARSLIQVLARAVRHRHAKLTVALAVHLDGPLAGDAQLAHARGAQAVAAAHLRPPSGPLLPGT